MERQPFQHVRLSPLWQSAIHSSRLNFNSDFEVTVDCVKVRRPVLSVIHRDHDS